LLSREGGGIGVAFGVGLHLARDLVSRWRPGLKIYGAITT
jgi:hypothetical protein